MIATRAATRRLLSGNDDVQAALHELLEEVRRGGGSRIGSRIDSGGADGNMIRTGPYLAPDITAASTEHTVPHQ